MALSPTVDYLERVLTLNRDQFATECEWPFLVGSGEIVRPSGPQRTIQGSIKEFASTLPNMPAFAPDKTRARAVLLAVRKVQFAFPNMITVGRTPNNDVVINDVQMSKFHAFFRIAKEGAAEVVDAGSRNGTFVRGVQVGKDGIDVHPGDTVRFARLEFTFFDASGAWDLVRRLCRS